jgi:hypothetical protein
LHYHDIVYGRQNKEQEASEYLVDAKKYSEDCSAFHHAIYGYLIQSNKEDAETLYQGLKNKNPQSNYVFMSEILTVTNVNNRRRNLQTDKMKLIILKFHIFYTYFTMKKS